MSQVVSFNLDEDTIIATSCDGVSAIETWSAFDCFCRCRGQEVIIYGFHTKIEEFRVMRPRAPF